MNKHSGSTVLGLAVLGFALIATPAFAKNLFTVNNTEQYGASGSKAFVPAFLSSQDPDGALGFASATGIYIPYLGTMVPCRAKVGEQVSENNYGDTDGACKEWGAASLKAWANGLYYDPRFGTPFIPPSGDHHRTGYRLLMQPSFSGGAWLSGFAQLNQRFPFFPEIGTAGPGGDVGQALATASEAGLNGILELTDAHGEPLTTGKFPRYWPHERAAWVDTLMVKYTAGTSMPGFAGSKFTQSLRSSVGFLRETDNVRWRAMSNIDGHFSLGGNADGCPTGWCEFYIKDGNGVSGTLYVVHGDGNTMTDDEAGGATVLEVTESTRLDTMGALGNGGIVLKTFALSYLEKLPTLIDDRLAQVDTDMDGSDFSNEAFGMTNGNPSFAEPAQALFSQIRIYSGPNVHSEEGADPYSWVICGTRGGLYGEDGDDVMGGCMTDSKHSGAIESRLTGINNGYGYNLAIVYNSNSQGNLGDSVLKRFGRDLNPTRFNAQVAPNAVQASTAFTGLDPAGDPDQATGVYVVCDGVGGGTMDIAGIIYNTSTCESSPGGDGMYGTFDDGTIYYKEAIENGLRGWIRETNGHSFSFLGARESNGQANFGLTTMVQQNIEGFLMSCLGCNPHRLPTNIETVTYTFDWPGNFQVQDFDHPPKSTSTIVILEKTTP